MIGGVEETSASFEARSAPRSYPTERRPGQEQNLLSPLSSDLPVRRFLDRRVESYFCFSEKYFCSHAPQIRSRLFASHPTEGRIAIVTDAGRDAVDAAAFCARWDCRAS